MRHGMERYAINVGSMRRAVALTNAPWNDGMQTHSSWQNCNPWYVKTVEKNYAASVTRIEVVRQWSRAYKMG
jgi:hypothetical protein